MQPEAGARPRRTEQLMGLVESFQPRDPAGGGAPPNRWSEIVRTAFMYSGAQKMFAAESGAIRALVEAQSKGAPIAGEIAGGDFVLAAIGEPARPAPPELVAEARRFLDTLENEDLLLHLHQVAEPCRLVAPPPYEGINAALTLQETFEQGAIKNLAIACCARMKFAAEDGEPERFLLSFRSGMRLGLAECGRPMMVSLMNGHAVQNRVMMQAMRAVVAGKLDASMCERMLGALERLRLPSPTVFVEIERVIGLDSIDRFFDRRVVEDARAREGEASSISDLSRSEATAAYDEAMDRNVMLVRTEVPTLGNASPLEVAPDTAPTLEGVTVNFDPVIMKWGPSLRIAAGRSDPEGFLHALMPPIGALCISEQEHRCLRAGLQTALLLELYRLEHGSLPERLAELAGVVKRERALPVDPCEPTRPLEYVPPPPTDRAGPGGYTLYSVGSDRVDNGGAAPSRERRNALIPGERFVGSDFVIVGGVKRDGESAR